MRHPNAMFPEHPAKVVTDSTKLSAPTCLTRAIDVRLVIVEKHDLRGFDTNRLRGQIEEPAVGLLDSHFTREEETVEPIAEPQFVTQVGNAFCLLGARNITVESVLSQIIQTSSA